MSILAIDSNRLSTVVKHEYKPALGFCREVLTANEASAITYKVGTVLGKVTASGKYKICDPTASDGSQTPVGVYVNDVNGNAGDLAVAATTDTKVVVLVRGPAIVAAGALVYAAGNQTQINTANAVLKGLGILPETTL